MRWRDGWMSRNQDLNWQRKTKGPTLLGSLTFSTQAGLLHPPPIQGPTTRRRSFRVGGDSLHIHRNTWSLYQPYYEPTSLHLIYYPINLSSHIYPIQCSPYLIEDQETEFLRFGEPRQNTELSQGFHGEMNQAYNSVTQSFRLSVCYQTLLQYVCRVPVLVEVQYQYKYRSWLKLWAETI